MVIFAYDILEDRVTEVEVLSNILSYFVPLPPALIEYIKAVPGARSTSCLIRASVRILPENHYPFGETSKGSDLVTRSLLNDS